MKKVLLVQPRFPLPSKSLNHKDFLPIGLLKLSSWHKAKGDDVRPSFGHYSYDPEWTPDIIYVTSLFTYWSQAVKEAVQFYRGVYGNSVPIVVGGIYASLAPAHCKEYTGCTKVHSGVHAAEACAPDYGLVDIDFQVIHASRGCIRKCAFCGTYTIEPEFRPKPSIRTEITKNHLVFYDNNLLANPDIMNIFDEITAARPNGRVVTCESQSGIDGRILREHPEYALGMKRARFRNVRIAWDAGLREQSRIEEQLQILEDAGFSRRQIQVFMIYNHDLPPEILVAKAGQCFDWGVQVADCRYRPLDLFEDGYRPMSKHQDDGEYYVHRGWSDATIRGFRRMVRANNICVRYGIPRDRYQQGLEGFSRQERHAIAADLGLTGSRHSAEELRLINQAWLARQGRPGD